MKKHIILILAIIIGCNTIMAQQDAQYTQYMFNTLAINPAYAGSNGVFSIAALHRSQWVGIEGAPSTQTFNFNTPISNRVGIGLSVVNDKIGKGVNEDTNIDMVFSYTVPLSETGKLSFGLKAGGHILSIDLASLRNYVAETNIPNIDKKFSPNFGAGVYYHTNNFYLGLSIPNFLETEHFDSSGSTDASFVAKELMNLYLITGYVFDLNPRLKFKPTALVKAVKGAPLQLDLSANFLFNNKFTLGAGYRWNAAASAMFGLQITNQLMIGLAYDKETSGLGDVEFNDGSFEVMLRYNFISWHDKVKTPRFF